MKPATATSFGPRPVNENFLRGRIQRLWIYAFAVAGVFTSPAHVNARERVEMNADALNTFLDKEIGGRLEALHIPGAAVVVVRDGRILALKGYGFSDVEKKIPVDPSKTMFRLASVTKIFTATAFMREYQESRIDLRRDLRAVMPGILRGSKHAVTPLHLLTHTAGFDERLIRMAAPSKESVVPLAQYLESDMPGFVRTPGSFYQYSNHGMALLGLLVEHTSGRSYDQYVEEEILHPLGMKNTVFPERSGMPANLARGYAYAGQKHIMQAPVFLNIAPAGSLISTAEDMGKFVKMHLENGHSENRDILRADTARFMRATAWRPHPDVAGSALGFYERLLNHERLIEHAGDLAGYSAHLVLIPESNTGWFLAYNLNPEVKLRQDFTHAFMNRWYPFEPAVLKPVENAKEAADAVSGNYRMTRYARRTWEKILSSTFVATVKSNENGTIEFRMPMDILPPMTLQLEDVSRSPSGFLFRETKGEGRIFFPDVRGLSGNNGRPLAIGMFMVPMAFEKLSWYESPVFQGVISSVCQLTFIVYLLSTLIRMVVRKFQRRGPLPLVDKTLLWMTLAHMVFLGAIGGILAYYQLEILFDLRWIIYPVLLLPTIGVFFTAASLVFLIQSLVRGEGSRWARTIRIWTTTAGLVFLWFLGSWNMLGFRI